MKGKIAAVAVLAIAVPVIAMWEGYRPDAYEDVVGVPTICYGYAGGDVSMDQSLADADCSTLLTIEVWEKYEGVMACVDRPVSNHEAAALTSWAYNVGVSAACGSTLMRKLNAGQPWCAQLDRWVYADGRKLKGLVRRRAAERQLCEGEA